MTLPRVALEPVIRQIFDISETNRAKFRVLLLGSSES